VKKDQAATTIQASVRGRQARKQLAGSREPGADNRQPSAETPDVGIVYSVNDEEGGGDEGGGGAPAGPTRHVSMHDSGHSEQRASDSASMEPANTHDDDISASTYTHTHTHTHTHTDRQTRSHTNTHTHTHTDTHTDTLTNRRIDTLIHTYTQMLMYSHTHTHTHTRRDGGAPW
jgi:hypothetical protein